MAILLNHVHHILGNNISNIQVHISKESVTKKCLIQHWYPKMNTQINKSTDSNMPGTS